MTAALAPSVPAPAPGLAPGASAEALIVTEKLTRHYRLGDETVTALDGVSLSIQHGDCVAVMGPSGSGKSTFMNVVGCLDRPTSGAYWLDGEEISRLGPDALAEVRNHKIGFVFQQFHLLDRQDALGNVELPLLYAGADRKLRRARATEALIRVGLGQRLHHRPTQLSGGQQQRVAVARALVNRPKMLLADEPTGALDSRTSLEIMALFQELNREGVTVVIVTHEPDVARFASRLIRFLDGRVLSDLRQSPADAAAELAALDAGRTTAGAEAAA
jgi:putative ABC transport system ATP-binding protein